jgi:serine/threonine-protein kinase
MAEKRQSEGEGDAITLVKLPKMDGTSASRVARPEGTAQSLALSPSPPPPPAMGASIPAPRASSSGGEIDARQDPLAPSGLPPDAVHDRDRYLERSVLGEGGMGRIHLCNDTRVGRDVAMKVLRQRYAKNPDTVARFVREARIQGQLEHPSIVPVYDLSRTPDNRICFTMKRVHGKTIEQIIDGLNAKDKFFIENYPRRKLLRAFSAACLAVDFAHSRGVLHRDLKPSNIMLGDFGEVYVLDWGLSKVAGLPDLLGERPVALPRDSGTDTLDGAVLGTPGYMSPEQARG